MLTILMYVCICSGSTAYEVARGEEIMLVICKQLLFQHSGIM